MIKHETFYVTIQLNTWEDFDALREWCNVSIPDEFKPSLTMRQTNNNTKVVNATFHNKHHAALFKLFWCER